MPAISSIRTLLSHGVPAPQILHFGRLIHVFTHLDISNAQPTMTGQIFMVTWMPSVPCKQ